MIAKLILLILGLLVESMFPSGIEPAEKYSLFRALMLTGGALAIYLLAGLAVASYAKSRPEDGEHKASRAMAVYGAMVIPVYGFILFWAMWPLVLMVDLEIYFPGIRQIFNFLPFLAAIMLGIIPGYIATKRDRTSPISFKAYAGFQFKSIILTALVPIFIINTAAEWLFGTDTMSYAVALHPHLEWTLYGALILAMLYMSPFLLRLLWSSRRVSDPALKERLVALAARAGVRCDKFFIWKTEGAVMNAAMAGFTPGTRHMFLTDALVARLSMEDVEAVAAHELGHAAKMHMIKYVVLLFGMMFAVTAIGEFASSLGAPAWAIEQGGIAVTAGFWLVVFTSTSRAFEAEADLFAADLLGEPSRFTGAMERLISLSGAKRDQPSITHSSMAKRVEFVWLAWVFPEKRELFVKRVAGIWMISMALFISGAAGAGISAFSGEDDGREAMGRLYRQDMFLRSVELYDSGMIAEGLILTEEAYVLDPRNNYLGIKLGEMYMEAGMADIGVEILRKISESKPASPYYRYYLYKKLYN